VERQAEPVPRESSSAPGLSPLTTQCVRQSFVRSRISRDRTRWRRENMRVGLVGIGMTALRPSTQEHRWEERLFEAACRAYAEADASLRGTRTAPKALAAVVAKNRRNALQNPLAAYAANVDVDQALESEERFSPLRALDIANPADGCVVLVLASERAAKRMHANPVWIRGIGWSTDSPSLETRDWTQAAYAQLAAQMAYRLAKVRQPTSEIGFAEVDDRFSFKELQHLEALGLAKKGEAGRQAMKGDYAQEGRFPVNPSGGSLGCGN